VESDRPRLPQAKALVGRRSGAGILEAGRPRLRTELARQPTLIEEPQRHLWFIAMVTRSRCAPPDLHRGRIETGLMRRGPFEPFRGLLGSSAGAVVAAIMASGCTGGSTAQPSSGQSPASTSAPLSAWQRLGATEVPPTSLKQVTLGRTQVVNEVADAVSDPEARTWAKAYLREYGYLSWATSTTPSTLGRFAMQPDKAGVQSELPR
jgi:hypothetical protein